jgi:hypothetical protein
VSKDLRTVLGSSVTRSLRARVLRSRVAVRCRRALLTSLRAAAAVPATEVYKGDPYCDDGDQWCWDAVRQRPIGGATQPLIAWINRPTFQQANEIQHRVAR